MEKVCETLYCEERKRENRKLSVIGRKCFDPFGKARKKNDRKYCYTPYFASKYLIGLKVFLIFFFLFKEKYLSRKFFFSSMVFLLFGSFSIILFDISSFYNGLIIANVPKAMFSCFDPTTKCFEYMRLKLEGGYTIYNNMRAYGRDGNGQHFVRALVRNRKVQKPLELSKLLFITFPFSKQIERSRTTIICPFASDATASMCVCVRA